MSMHAYIVDNEIPTCKIVSYIFYLLVNWCIGFSLFFAVRQTNIVILQFRSSGSMAEQTQSLFPSKEAQSTAFEALAISWQIEQPNLGRCPGLSDDGWCIFDILPSLDALLRVFIAEQGDISYMHPRGHTILIQVCVWKDQICNAYFHFDDQLYGSSLHFKQ